MTKGIFDGFVPFIVIVTVVVIGGGYWWSRKSAKHPEWAAAKEKEIDALLEGLKKYAPDHVDVVLEKIQSVDAVGGGQALYANIERRLNTLETKINEVLTRLPK